MADDIDVPPPTSSPYPPDTEPIEGAELRAVEVVEVAAPSDGRRNIAFVPFVQAVAMGVAVNLVYDAGKYVVKEAWKGREEIALNHFERPPILWADGYTYRLQNDGSYRMSGSAQMS